MFNQRTAAQLRRQAALLDLTDDAVLVWQLDGPIEYWNAGAERLYGYKSESAVGEVSHNLLRTEFPKSQNATLAELSQVNRWEGELIHTAKGGRRIVVSAVMILNQQDGRPTVLEVNRDITARKQVEASLRQWADAFENCAHGIAMGLPDSNRILVCNPALGRMLGRPAAEIAGTMILSLYAPEDHAHVRACIAQADRVGHVVYESHMVRQDGSRFPVQMDVVTVRGADGQPIYRVATAQDITARRKAEQFLRESEERLRLALQAASQGLYDLNLQTGEALVTPEYATMLGYDPATFRETNAWWVERLHPDDREKVSSVYRDYVAGKIPNYSVEFRQRTRAGDWKWLLSTGRIVAWDAQGRPLRMLGTHTDITARKLAEEEVRRLNASLEKRVAERTAQLEAANRELEAFSYSVSHDLRAPLRAMHGYISYIEEDYSSRLDAEGNRLLGVVRGEARRMGQLIEDLLTFSRLGRQDMKWIPVDMQELARHTFEDLTAVPKSTPPQFQLGRLPTVHGDLAMLRQVFTNLISNAIKFSARAPAPVIEIGHRDEGQHGVYYVKDNGVGFDEKYGDKLFGVFQRLHREEEFPGTGVGLALVQRIINRHGGRVWAESKPDQGATFYFTLPKNATGSPAV